jgi:hypothetical protein
MKSINGKAIPIFVYTINNKAISKNFVKYKSITETSFNEKRARGTIGLYLDTNIPFRNKIYYSKPLVDLDSSFNEINSLSKDLNIISNKPKKV